MINEQEVFETWAPVIEQKTGIKDQNKVTWLTKYAHYHSLNEAAGAYNTLAGVPGQGQITAPNRGTTGSGDKFPSLLPLAIQVAAKTVGFDIVPVIPMPGPTGVLTYLDYVYAGGKLDSAVTPIMIKIQTAALSSGQYAFVNPTTYYASSVVSTPAGDTGVMVALTFIGKSRIDGYDIFKVGSTYSTATVGGTAGYTVDQTVTISNIFGTAATFYSTLTFTGAPATGALTGPLTSVGGVTWAASLVSALEDHIPGFTGAGLKNQQNYQGPYEDTTAGDYTNADIYGDDSGFVSPMARETGETTYYQSMGLKTFTKFVEARTFQVAASVTTEQIQDLNKQFGIDVVSMVENALVNEVSQSINRNILGQAFNLGYTNATAFAAVEGQALDLDLNTLPTAGQFENLQTTQRRIFGRILAAANVVANRGRRGPANFVVTNAQIATAIQDISQFVAAPFANTASQNNGSLYPVGTLAGLTVYVDQNMQWSDTRVLIGRKGADDEPGLKFMPYMMAESITTISEGTMSPKIAVKSRYALVQAGFHPETMYFALQITPPTNGIV